jgi:hypothetical protein
MEMGIISHIPSILINFKEYGKIIRRAIEYHLQLRMNMSKHLPNPQKVQQTVEQLKNSNKQLELVSLAKVYIW